MSTTWGNWQKDSGVLGDRKMPVKLRGKIILYIMLPSAKTIHACPFFFNKGEKRS